MCQQLLDNKFQCPICGSTVYPLMSVGSPFPILTELQVIGAGPRLQKCHGCSSSDRDRLVYLYLRDIENIFSKDHASISVLHVAPENCIAEKFLDNSQIHYAAIDSFEHGYDYPEYIKKMHLLYLKFEDHTIDLVLCNHVLQDISDDISALKEIYRVLVPGGKAILQVPISPVIDSIMEHKGYLSEEECIKRYGQRFHKRIYNVEGYIARLKSIGFMVEVVKISKHYPIASVNQNEILFIAYK